jgi:hypothetical protein
VAVRDVSSTYRASSTWREVGVCRLHTDWTAHGGVSPPWATRARMQRRVDIADWKDVWNDRQSKYDDMVFTRQDGKFMMDSLWRRPLTLTVSKALATYRKTAPVSLFSTIFLLILSTRRANCRVVLQLGRNLNWWPRSSPRSFTSRRTLVSTIVSKSFPTVSRRPMGLQEEGSVGSFSGFSMDTTRACFHACGKYCLPRTALKHFREKGYRALW